jgi:flagellar protein FliO/FliZ
LGGEKLKPSFLYHVEICLLVSVLALIGAGGGRSGLGAQEAAGGGGLSGELTAADDAGASGPSNPAEQNIFLGENVPGAAVPEPGPVSGFVILRTVLVLILAAAAIYGAVHVVKRFSQPRDPINSSLRVLASVRLGPGRFVHAVALGSRVWLVGAGEGGISPIADVTEQEALDALFLEESRRNGASIRSGDFQALFRRLGVFKAQDRGFSPGEEEEGRDDLAEKIRRRSDRLRGL